MTAKKKTVIGYVLASLAIIAADQALKAWVVRNIPLNASAAQQRALIPGVVHLTHIRNSGVAFGMFSGGRWLFLALLAAFCVIVVWALVRHKLTAPWERWLAVLAMAGAIGNGIDRALYGYVVDMFELEFMHFAVFNIADIAINVCCILFVLLMLLRKEPEKPEQPEENSGENVPTEEEPPAKEPEELTEAEGAVLKGEKPCRTIPIIPILRAMRI